MSQSVKYKAQVMISDIDLSIAMMYKYGLKATIYFDAEAESVIVGFDDDASTTVALYEHQTTGKIEVDSAKYPEYFERSKSELSNVDSYVLHVQEEIRKG